MNLRELNKQIADLPPEIIIRVNQVGDLPGRNETISLPGLRMMTKALVKRKKKPFTFSHKMVLGNSALAKANLTAIQEANEAGFIIALSANNLKHADKLKKVTATLAKKSKNENTVPVVVSVDNFDTMPKYTPDGHKLTPCPEQVTKRQHKLDGVTKILTCADCRICSKPRETIVAFENSSRRKVYKNSLTAKSA